MVSLTITKRTLSAFRCTGWTYVTLELPKWWHNTMPCWWHDKRVVCTLLNKASGKVMSL